MASFRSAVGISHYDPPLMLEYAKFLVAHSRGPAAEEVLAIALAHDGALVDALELYLELVRELNLPDIRARWALERLRADIDNHPHSHRAALDYAIPYRMEDLLDRIGTTSDPVSRAITHIDRTYENGTPPTLKSVPACAELGENDSLRAHLTVTLGRGDHSVSIALLEQADSRAVPINALRRAIRRVRATDGIEWTLAYLEKYLSLRPHDSWALHLQDEAQKSAHSNIQIGRTGFPFPDTRANPAFDVEPRRVLYLVHNSLPYSAAGYATRTHGLLSALNREGWHIDGVTRLGYPYDLPGMADIPDVAAIDDIGNVTYRRLLSGREIERKNPIFHYTEKYADAVAHLAHEERPALLHAASNHLNGLAAVTAARQLGIPSIYEVRGLWEVTRGSRDASWMQSDEFHFLASMEADVARGATRVITITSALRDEMVRRGVDSNKIRIVPNGVDTSRFTPIPRDEELASQLNLVDCTVIGYVGSVLDYEGLDLLLESAEILNRTREDFHLLVVGGGAELRRLQQKCRDRELDHVVTFTGRVPHEDVERYYSLIDIAPFPRLPLPVCEMVSPLKPFEAMAMSKAVIASDVAALAEIISPGVNGFLHAKGDVDSLVEMLTKLLDDPDLTRRIGERSRTWVTENRDWTRLATNVADIYREIT